MNKITPKDISLYSKCVALTDNAAVFDVDIHLNGSFPYCSNEKVGEANLIVNFITGATSMTQRLYGYDFESLSEVSLYISQMCIERCNPIVNTTETKTEQV